MTTVADAPRTADATPGRPGPPPRRPPTASAAARAWRWLGFAALAAVAYIPVLRTHPGKVDADTKSYLYLDPGRLLSSAWNMWDPKIGMGTVTHQNIGYLFPMGPFYWLLEQGLGVPSWVAERLWLGSLLFAAGLGMRYLLRTLGVRGPGVAVGILAYMFTPYVVEYSSRFTGLLAPWAALPWMIAFVALALRRGGWKYPALFAITVQLVGGVNATALICAGLGPVLWIPYSVWIVHESTFRRAVSVVLRIGLLTLLTSLWWIVGLWAQSGYGLDVLAYTETVETVSKTAYANEILRGLGYWFFYFRDRLGAWNDGASNYTQVPWLILVSYLVPTLALLAAAVVRWRHRVFFVFVALIGVVIAVGSSPFNDPSPLGSLFKSFATSSTFGLALRSTSRAVPLVVLGLAALLAAGVSALYDALKARDQAWIGIVAAVCAGALVLASFPAIWEDVLYSRYLERNETVPAYWHRALRYLDSRPHDTRILALPGSDFAAYRWGVTIDPIEPGLIDRPYVARELVPWGSPPSADLLNALDRKVQYSALDPTAIAPIARLMGVGDVLLRLDMQTERYDLVRSDPLWRAFSPPPPGLETAKTFGTKIPGKPRFPQIDEATEVTPPGKSPPPVAVLGVKDAENIVRTNPTARPLLVAGNGEGLIDLASIGLLDGNQVVQYSGSYAGDPSGLQARLKEGATLVVTDSNRRRGLRWTGARDTPGYTEQAGEKPLVTDLRDARLDLFPDAGDSARTVARLPGVKSVQASGYGTPGLSYPPDYRPERVLDGDPTTSWQVGGLPKEMPGNRLRIVLDHPITTSSVNLLQPITGDRGRYVTDVTMRFDGGDPVRAQLVRASRDESGAGQTVRFPRRTFRTFEIRIDKVHLPPRPFADVSARQGHNARYNTSNVGFGEIRLRDDAPGAQDVRVDEQIRMPTDLLQAAGQRSIDHPLVLAMTLDGRAVPQLTRPERNLVRVFALPTARDFALSGTTRLDSAAPDDAIDAVLGIPTDPATGGTDVTSSQHLEGDVRVRGSAAVDGNPATAWSTPFGNILQQWVKVASPRPLTLDHLDLQVVNDRTHSVPRQITITSDDGTTRVVEVPPVGRQRTAGAVAAAPVHFDPITGSSFTFTLTGVREVKRVDYQTLSRNVMPVAIAELGIPGLAPVVAPAQVPTTCRTDLVTMDGKPLPVQMSGSTASAVAGGPLSLAPCAPGDAVALAKGEHILRTVKGPVSGVDFDRVVLSSAAGGAAASVPQLVATASAAPSSHSPRLRVLKHDATSMTVQVDRAKAPFWMVLGQSLNKGWQATADGKDLGEPKLVDGYANGWLVKPSGSGPITIRLEWVPQKVVRVGLLLSILGGLLCLGIIAVAQLRVRRRRKAARAAALVDPDAPPDPLLTPLVLPPILASPFVSRGRRPGVLGIIGATLLAGVVTALIVRPWCGLLVAAAVLLVLLRPRWRAVLSLFPFLALGLCGLYVAVVQFRSDYPVGLEWPGAFWRARTLGWLAIVFLAADVLVGLARRADGPAADPDSAVSESQPDPDPDAEPESSEPGPAGPEPAPAESTST